MSNPTEPTWISEGADVAIRETNNEIEFVRIERLTPTTITVAGGRKFRRSGYFKELATDNGNGRRINRDGKLTDPTEGYILERYAQQQLRGVVAEAAAITSGSAATIYGLDPQGVRNELIRLVALAQAALEEVDRRTQS